MDFGRRLAQRGDGWRYVRRLRGRHHPGPVGRKVPRAVWHRRDLSGFEIPDGDIWNPTIGTDSLTIAHDWQPLDTSDSKAYWHYDGVDLATAGYGYVSEELDFGDPYQFYVWGANDLGPGNPSTIGATIAPSLARRIDVARIEGNTLTLFRNGASAATFDLTGRGPISSEAPLRLGNPCDHYAFATWDRALSNDEIALLTAGFADPS